MNGAGDLAKDLYRDLRDRRLLPVAIVLAVAILAVPFLLGGGGDEPVATTAPVSTGDAGGGSTAALTPVVLADVPGLRDYRQRLSRFNRRDPFKQQMTGDKGAQSGKGNLEQTTTTSTTSSSSSSSSSSTADTTTSSDSGTSSSGGKSSGSNGSKSGGKPEDRVVVTTIDVRVGKPGDTKVMKGVESLQFLPGAKTPVVQFVEGDSDGKHAAFVVSPDVTETDGDGKCDPGKDDCQFLLMEKNDVRTFVYGDQQTTYRLQLLAIHRDLVPVDGNG